MAPRRFRSRLSSFRRVGALRPLPALLIGLAVLVIPSAGWSRVSAVRTGEAAQAAIDSAQPGDEIVLADGTWPDLRLTISSRGDTSAPLVLRAASPGGAVLTGEPRIRITGTHTELRGLTLRDCTATTGSAGAIVFDGAQHCRLTGTTFERCRLQAVALVGFRNRASDNRLDHCRFLETRFRCAQVVVDKGALRDGPPRRNRIDHNLFQDVAPRGANGAETIQIGQAAVPCSDQRPETLIEDNLFIRCNGEAEIISVKTSGNTIRNNLFRDCDGELVMRHGHGNRAEGNRFEGGMGGIRLAGGEHSVTGNVMIGCRGTGIRLYYGTPDTGHPASYLPVRDCRIADNILVECGEAGILVGDQRNARYENPKWSGAPWFARSVMECTVAPSGNVIENNLLTGHGDRLIRVVEAPGNLIRDNLLQVTVSSPSPGSGPGSAAPPPHSGGGPHR